MTNCIGNDLSGFLRLRIHPWGLLASAGTIACSATVLGFLGRVCWFADLFSHFRVQYLLGLGILGLAFLIARRFRAAVVLFAFAALNLFPVLPMYFGEQKDVPEEAQTMRAMLINVNTSHGDPQRVKQVIQEVKPDILVLEEISERWISELAWLTNSLPYHRWEAREDNFGIGLFSRFPFVASDIEHIGEAMVPSIFATVHVGQTNIQVIATHPVPPAGSDYSRWRNDQLEQLPDRIRSPLPTILLGDLNTTPWNYYFRRFVKRSGLLDSAKGHGVQPTWPTHNPLLRVPIDHFLYSPGIAVAGRKIGPNAGSDHYPLIVDFSIPL